MCVCVCPESISRVPPPYLNTLRFGHDGRCGPVQAQIAQRCRPRHFTFCPLRLCAALSLLSRGDEVEFSGVGVRCVMLHMCV